MTKIVLKLDKAYLTWVTKKGQKGLDFPTGVKQFNDIPYIDDGSKFHLLDIYVPEGIANEKLPVIVNIHGGSWCFADKETYKIFCMDICKRGFAVINFSYTLAPEATYAEQIREIYAVFDWLIKNQDNYPLDMNNVYAIGDSAGAQLCGLAVNITYDESLQKLFNVKPPFMFNAMCLNCGASELKDMADKMGKLVFKHIIGKDFKKSPYYDVANYSDSIPDNSCPVFCITSYKDFMRDMALEVYEKIKAKGITTKLSYIDKGEHHKKHKPIHVYNLNPYWEESIKTNDDMCDFFKQFMK